MTYDLVIDGAQQLDPDLWRGLVRHRAGYRCERCNEPEKKARLTAHHRDRDHTNYCLDNGECLCKVCHHIEHHGRPEEPEATKTLSAEHRAAISRGLRGNKNRAGKPCPEETKEKIRATYKAKQ